MKIEKMEVVGIDVQDVEKAARLFEDLLGIKFRHCRFGVDVKPRSAETQAPDPAAPDLNSIRLAIDPTGYLELVQTGAASTREGFRNLHFKVTDIEEAKAELKQKEIEITGLKQRLEALEQFVRRGAAPQGYETNER